MQIGLFVANAVHAIEDHFDAIRRYQTYRMIGARQDTMLRVSQRLGRGHANRVDSL